MATPGNGTLLRLALDSGIDQAARLKAVVAMGAGTSPPSLQGLRAVVATADPAVQRRAIERLGKLGTPNDLEFLRQIRTDNPVTKQWLRTATAFISYRHRLGTDRLDSPRVRVAAETTEAAPIRSGAPTEAMTNRMRRLVPAVPGIRLAEEPVRRFECGSSELALVLNQDVIDDGAATLPERQALLAVLLRYNNETGAYDPAYYFLTDPSRSGTFRVSGARSSGRVGVHGTGSVEGTVMRFEVNASESPDEHPLTVTGSFDLATGALDFETARVEPRFSELQQQGRKQPRLIDRPER
ncbi:HEAT repeat domain-containing protein (plasmid) [Rhodococcus opacus]|uniref:HEAT repeat domain-containing protein n=1 Tax=Rhodococcus opacus TaxID=37919 RepID=A0ABT4NLF7_RHOOP|nr:HEAT repeat domain-containing protein [Rhodococcus opacus]MCZ4588217.1 HEAT repeat domain-containing protein [Rhodococcus opacus]MDV7087620.1 HEAT repeat domain-containing protein [Rhodococcus opacus]WKN61096.1 HEAT repeat domain-containing protein [Rhodococcus opacus]